MRGPAGAACRCSVYSRAMGGRSVEREWRIVNGGARFFMNVTSRTLGCDIMVGTSGNVACPIEFRFTTRAFAVWQKCLELGTRWRVLCLESTDHIGIAQSDRKFHQSEDTHAKRMGIAVCETKARNASGGRGILRIDWQLDC